MQILDDKVFCSVAAKWKNLIKGYAWTVRPHKTFNILQDHISKLKFIHNFTITHTCTNRCFPFHLSPFVLFSPFSQLNVNVKTGQCWKQPLLKPPGPLEILLPLSSAFTQQITERKHRAIKHAIQGSLFSCILWSWAMHRWQPTGSLATHQGQARDPVSLPPWQEDQYKLFF